MTRMQKRFGAINCKTVEKKQTVQGIWQGIHGQ